jgi:hypothetical protein
VPFARRVVSAEAWPLLRLAAAGRDVRTLFIGCQARASCPTATTLDLGGAARRQVAVELAAVELDLVDGGGELVQGLQFASEQPAGGDEDADRSKADACRNDLQAARRLAAADRPQHAAEQLSKPGGDAAGDREAGTA